MENLPLWSQSHVKSGRLSTLDFKWEKIHSHDLYIGTNKPIAKTQKVRFTPLRQSVTSGNVTTT